MNQRSLEELAAWAEADRMSGRNAQWRWPKQPHAGFWPKDAARIPALLRRVRSTRTAQHQRAFDAFCLAAGLAAPEPQPVLQALRELFSPQEAGLPFSWEDVGRMTWLGLPLVLAGNDKGHIVFVLLGVSDQDGPAVLAAHTADGAPLLDAAAAEAIHTAGRLAGVEHFVFWLPNLSPLPCDISGASLGLPVYAGFALLKRGRRTWPHLLCSGCLEPDGRIGPVEGLAHKITAARDAQFRGLIYPDANAAGLIENSPDDFEHLPVPNTDTARVLLECYLPEQGHEQLSFYRRRHDIDYVVRNIGRAPFAFLQFLENRDALLSDFVRQNVGRREHRQTLLNTIENTFSGENAVWLLEQLFPEDSVCSQIQTDPQTAWQAAQLYIQHANHQGDIGMVQQWMPVADTCLHALLQEQEVDSERVLLIIYNIISQHHNQYDFSPNLAQQREPRLTRLIAGIEERWQRRRQTNPHAAEKLLGQYHGTLAQHYGFCGVTWRKQADAHIDKALNAFGNGEYAPLKDDWRRIFAYRFFCHLDAGNIRKAGIALESYLGADPQRPDWKRLNSFEHFLLARGLAESRADADPYTRQMPPEFLHTRPPEHPWQLWALNMGRIVTDSTLQKACWETSLRLCLNAKGPTIRIMGLMPLARLARAGLADETFLKTHIQQILRDCENSGLNQAHFAPLWQAPWREVAERVHRDMARYFPFSYR